MSNQHLLKSPRISFKLAVTIFCSSFMNFSLMLILSSSLGVLCLGSTCPSVLFSSVELLLESDTFVWFNKVRGFSSVFESMAWINLSSKIKVNGRSVPGTSGDSGELSADPDVAGSLFSDTSVLLPAEKQNKINF